MKLFLLALINVFLCFVSKYITKKFDLYDYPTNRKQHSKPTSYLGGLILSCLILIFMGVTNFENPKINLLLIGCVMISWVGFIDDKYNLNVGGKIALQIIPILYLIINNLQISNLGEYFGFNLYLGDAYIIFSILIYYIFINAFNYSDGIDGNILVQFLSIMFLLLFLNFSQEINYIIQFMIISSFIFLIFNLSNSTFKFFMGDSGSMMLGFFTIGLLNIGQIYFKIQPITLLWVCSYILFEFVATNLQRILNNKEIFQSGNDHLHYAILKNTNSKYKTILLLFVINIALGTFGIKITSMLGSGISLIFYFFFFLIYFFF